MTQHVDRTLRPVTILVHELSSLHAATGHVGWATCECRAAVLLRESVDQPHPVIAPSVDEGVVWAAFAAGVVTVA